MIQKLITLSLIVLYLNGYSQNTKEYESTHGEEITGYIAPYLKNVCLEENLNCDSLVELLFEDSLRTENFHSNMPFSLSSGKYITGNWTYYKAKTPLIYEIEKLESGKYLILYSKQHPELILTNGKSEWRLALIDKNLRIIDDKPFVTTWKYENEYYAMWDMIYTKLDVGESSIAVITYVHSGGGGGRDQVFIAQFKTDDKIGELSVIQTVDDIN